MRHVYQICREDGDPAEQQGLSLRFMTKKTKTLSLRSPGFVLHPTMRLFVSIPFGRLQRLLSIIHALDG